MRLKLKNLWAPFVATMGLLIFFEIISSTLFPIVGIQNYRLPFHILIVLYLWLYMAIYGYIRLNFDQNDLKLVSSSFSYQSH